VFAWFLIVILLAGLFLSYFKGVKRERPWGKRAVAACAAGVIVLGLGKAFFHGQPGPGASIVANEEDRLSSQEMQRAKLIGQGLSGCLRPGAKVFFLGYMPTDMRRDWDTVWPAWQEGLSKGLGSKEWESAGYFGPASAADAAALSAALAEKEATIDAVVSFDGLPTDLHAVSIYAREKPPEVAVAFRSEPDRQLVRTWLRQKLIRAAVIEGKLYTRDDPP